MSEQKTGSFRCECNKNTTSAHWYVGVYVSTLNLFVLEFIHVYFTLYLNSIVVFVLKQNKMNMEF